MAVEKRPVPDTSSKIGARFNRPPAVDDYKSTYARYRTWPGWITYDYAAAYFGSKDHEVTGYVSTEGTAEARLVDWPAVPYDTAVSALRMACMRLEALEWRPEAEAAVGFPSWELERQPPIAIMNAACELAWHYLQRPDDRFIVDIGDAQRDVGDRTVGFRLGRWKNDRGDIPFTVMAMLERWLAAPVRKQTGRWDFGDDDVKPTVALPGFGIATGGP